MIDNLPKVNLSAQSVLYLAIEQLSLACPDLSTELKTNLELYKSGGKQSVNNTQTSELLKDYLCN